MGIYLNPGNENFKEAVFGEIYVDKSMMLAEMNRMIDLGKKYVVVSRPRRFGKTITGNMLAAYYSRGCDSEALFSRCKISSMPGYRDKMNQYNVIQIDMNSEYQGSEDKKNLLRNLSREVKEELENAFPSAGIRENDSLARSLLRVYAATGESFVIILDEYDVLVREDAGRDMLRDYLGFLNGLFKSNPLRPWRRPWT